MDIEQKYQDKYTGERQSSNYFYFLKDKRKDCVLYDVSFSMQ